MIQFEYDFKRLQFDCKTILDTSPLVELYRIDVTVCEETPIRDIIPRRKRMPWFSQILSKTNRFFFFLYQSLMPVSIQVAVQGFSS